MQAVRTKNDNVEAPIDFVITWVDGSDPKWREQKRIALGYDDDSGRQYYRDWGLLRYWFRSVEAYAPWVNQVHFVTFGQVPKWLNTRAEKLRIVDHKDFIPQKYLPTFSSHPIELNLHRIPGISERFVYFNDDMFLTSPVSKDFFFKNGLPCDVAALNVHAYALSRAIQLISIRDVGVINEHFDMRRSIRSNLGKWLSPKNGLAILRTLALLPCPRFPGMYQTHAAQPLLRSTYEKVWSVEPELLDETCMHKTRQMTDVNQWVMREWQIAEGAFVPRGIGWSATFHFESNDKRQLRKAVETIGKGCPRLICINDAGIVDEELCRLQREILQVLESKLPYRSDYEL